VKKVEDADFQRVRGRYGRKFKIAPSVEVEAPVEYVHFYPDGTIDKININVSNESHVYVITTGSQRGTVLVFDASLT